MTGSGDSMRVGVSGHQGLSPEVVAYVRTTLLGHLRDAGPVVGVTSLAAGADQLFASCVLELGGRLEVIVPCQRYEESFTDEPDLAEYRRLLSAASAARTLDFDRPSEAAYLAAGLAVVDASSRLIAVWDGQPARGTGGTADVVEYATGLGREVTIVWPAGVRRQ